MLNMDSIYNEYAQIVYKFLMSLCYEEDTAEELTQETFYQAVRCSNKYDGTCKVSTWLCQIAKHLWYRELEHRKKKKTETLTEEIVSISKSPDEEIEM
ncbi:MAG: RNA polymerase sigma factor [Lachnospiraceae bacterium]